jgi:outer membrane protein assembly factor BamB
MLMALAISFLLAGVAPADDATRDVASKRPAKVQSHWNQFRGPGGDGRSLAMDLPVEFSETKNVRWKTVIHGKGYSSPVVWGNQVWLTTAREDGRELFALCVDLKSGKIIHDIKVFGVAKPQSAYSYLNSHATPTPVIEAGRIYVHFGSYGTACLDTTNGKKLWERRDFHCDHRVRPGSSPIVDQELLFVAFDGVDKQFFVALDKKTGKTRWVRDRNVKSDWDATLRARGIDPRDVKKKKPGDNKKSYATAKLIELDGRRQLIAPAAEATISYDPVTGKELWRVHHLGGFNVACRPLFEHGLVYLFTSGLTGHFLAVRPTGSGDVTDTHVAWSTTRSTPHIPSPIIVDDLMFTVTEKGGIARCLEARTGEEIWRKRVGGSHWASPLFADGKIYFFSKEGRISVISAEREFQLVAENRLDASFIASPAVAGKALILRSEKHLYHVAQGFTRPAETRLAAKPAPAQKTAAGTKPMRLSETELEKLAVELKAAVANGKLTEREAIAKYKEAAAGADDKPSKTPVVSVDLKELGRKLKAAVAAGEMTEKEAIAEYKEATAKAGGKKPGRGTGKSGVQQLGPAPVVAKLTYKGVRGKDYIVVFEVPSKDAEEKSRVVFVGERFRKQFAGTKIGAMTSIVVGGAGGEAMAMKGKGAKKGGKKGGANTFYSIVIGRLKSKDVELGEFTLDVDYITAIYGDRSLKQTVLGKTVKVVGISGAWLDTLLLIKRGETLKFRSGTLQGTTFSLSPKATVLERAVPFDPETYPVPAESFRGFRGVVVGTITEKSEQGYELTLKINSIESSQKSSRATDPKASVGRLMSMRGFFDQKFQAKFGDLKIGDRIRLGAVHTDPTVDSFTVVEELEKQAATTAGDKGKSGK